MVSPEHIASAIDEALSSGKTSGKDVVQALMDKGYEVVAMPQVMGKSMPEDDHPPGLMEEKEIMENEHEGPDRTPRAVMSELRITAARDAMADDKAKREKKKHPMEDEEEEHGKGMHHG
jgi:hypothetical protein